MLNWEYSGWDERTSVMLVAERTWEKVRRERRKMRAGRDIGNGEVREIERDESGCNMEVDEI